MRLVSRSRMSTRSCFLPPSPPPQSPGLLRREKVQYEENSLASCKPNTNLQTILPPTRWAKRKGNTSRILSPQLDMNPPLSTSGWITRNSWWNNHPDGHLCSCHYRKKSILQFRKLCSNTLTTNYHVRKVDKSKQLLKVIQNFCLDVNLPELIFQIYMVTKKSLK